MVKRLTSNPPSPSAFTGMGRVKAEVLTVGEENECRLREQKQHIHWKKVAMGGHLVKEEIEQLKVDFLSMEWERAQPQINQADLITSIIQGMLS